MCVLKMDITDEHSKLHMEGNTDEILTLLTLATVQIIKELPECGEPEMLANFINLQVKAAIKMEEMNKNG